MSSTNTHAYIPRLRFAEFSGEWEETKLGNISKRLIKKNKEYNENVLTISGQLGLISQLEYFNKSVAAKDLSGYYVLEKGDFAYNKSYSNGYPMGAIKKLNRYEKGVVSTLYICFSFDTSMNSNFIEQYFETGNHNYEIKKVAQEGARNHGLLNIGVSDFFDTYIILPPLPEQTKIASFLTAVDDKLQSLSDLRSAWLSYKTGVMQQLFSQNIRFAGFDDEWEEKKLERLGKFFSGGTPSTTKSQYYNGDIPFIKSGEINSNYTDQFLTGEGLENSSAKLVCKGDILYALYGATSGQVAIAKIDGAINQAILCIKSNENNYFVYTWLSFQKENIIKTYLQGGQGNLSAEIVKALKINMPSLTEQEKIANFLTQIDQKISDITQQIDTAKHWKKGLLQRLFI